MGEVKNIRPVTRQEIVAKIKANAKKENRPLDHIDNFLIQMVTILGPEVTDRYING